MRNTTEATAGYAQLDFNVGDKWKATAGVRYTDEEKDYDFFDNRAACQVTPLPATCIDLRNSASVDVDLNPMTPNVQIPLEQRVKIWTARIALNHEAAGELLLFASATRGFNSGAQAARATLVRELLPVGPEKVWSYEIGGKSEWLDRKLRVSATLFYQDTSGFRAGTAFVNPATGALSLVTRNLADLEHKGLQLELIARPIAPLTLTLAAGIQDIKLKIDDGAPAVDSFGFVSPAAQLAECRAALAGQPSPLRNAGTAVARAQGSCSGVITNQGELAEPVRAPAPESEFDGRLVFPYTQPVAGPPPADGNEPTAAPGRTMRVQDPALMSPRDVQRAEASQRARPTSADASWALANALRESGLEKARLGIDDLELQTTLGLRQMGGEIRPAENVLRRTRLAKSATEIRLMRLAARQNVDAAMAAARAARALGSTRLPRARFFAEAAARGNASVFMVINCTSTEVLAEEIKDGMAFSIDCVSSCRLYHGDFARTIFVGEPKASVKRATTAIATAWSDIRSQLKAGVRFADIPRLGRESLRKQGVDLKVSFTPHSVGLFHTDHPQPSLLSPRAPDDLVLEVGTVLSVDCPVLEAGLGGTMHLEDLMLIRADGAKPIHHVPEPLISI